MGESDISDSIKDKLVQHFSSVHTQLDDDNSKKRNHFVKEGWIFTAMCSLIGAKIYHELYDGWAPIALGALYGAVTGHFTVYAYHNGWRKAVSEIIDAAIPENFEFKQRLGGGNNDLHGEDEAREPDAPDI